MKKYLVYSIAVLLLGCSKENWSNTIQPDINFFDVPIDATGTEAELRREFFNDNGIYLLFTDTLGYREVTTLSGKISVDWQVIDFNYTMRPAESSYVDSLKLFRYQNIEQKKLAAEWLSKEVIPGVADLFHPYSIVLVDSFDMYKNAGTAYEELVDSTYLYTAFQASVIAIGDVQKTTPETLQFLKTHLIQQMVIDKIHLIPEEEFETFYSYTEAGGWYEQYFGWLPDPVQQTGLLKCDYWSTKADDKLDYVKEMYSISEDEFREKWGEWPIIISKMEEMKAIFKKYGVNVYE